MIKKMTIGRARSLVRQYTAGNVGIGGNAAEHAQLVEQIATRMIASDECVWHAVAKVTGKQCRCNDCAT